MSFSYRPSPSPLLLFTAGLIVVLGVAGSLYQVTLSSLFHCGREGASPDLWYWTLAAAIQSLAFLWAGWSAAGERFYRATQWAAMPLIAFVVYQLSAVHARPMLLVSIGVAAYALLARALDRRRAADVEPAWSRLILEGVLFVLAVAVIQAALALPVLYGRGLRLHDFSFNILLVLSLVLAFVVVRFGCRVGGTRLNEVPPLFLLLMILLRAKLPDASYDALFYKATSPMMIADWRTALTGLPDHTLLGTNLQEILNSQWRILDPGYASSFLSTLAFAGLWIVAPSAARACANLLPVEAARRNVGFTLNASALLMVSLSEPLTAAGTAYQEPLQVLLLAAGLLAGPLGWMFLAAAAAVKVTALFFLPLLLVIRAAGVDREAVRVWLETPVAMLRERLGRMRDTKPKPVRPYAAKRKWGALAIAMLCGGLAVFIFGEQLVRNQLLAGRLLAPSEMLAGVTDPQGRFMSRVERDVTFDVAGTQKPFDSLVSTLIHMGTLDEWMAPDQQGFHVIPSSRLPMVAVFLALLALWCARKQASRPWALLTLLYVGLFTIYLQFFLQGRHMAPASFAALVLIASAPVFLWKGEMPRGVLAALTLAVGFLAVGDQMVGNFINDGWDCRRELDEPAVAPVAAGPAVTAPALDRKLADIVAAYRAKAPVPQYIIPSVLCDQHSESKPYFGAHYVYASVTQSLLRRYFKADPQRYPRLDRSALAVCIQNRDLIALGPDVQHGFVFAGRVDWTDIYVSRFLMEGGAATQLVPAGFPSPSFLQKYDVIKDFGATWDSGVLADASPQQTPSGKGALNMTVGADTLPTLVAPNALTFGEFDVRPGDRIHMQTTLPFGQSDGLRVELRLAVAGSEPLILRRTISRKRTAASDGATYTDNLTVPDGSTGRAVLTVRISSEGGDPDADWLAFRKLQLQRRIGY